MLIDGTMEQSRGRGCGDRGGRAWAQLSPDGLPILLEVKVSPVDLRAEERK